MEAYSKVLSEEGGMSWSTAEPVLGHEGEGPDHSRTLVSLRATAPIRARLTGGQATAKLS